MALVPSDFARISRRGIVHFTLIFFRTVLAYLPYKVQHKCNKCGIHQTSFWFPLLEKVISIDWKFGWEEQYQFGNGSKKSTYEVNMIDFNLISLSYMQLGFKFIFTSSLSFLYRYAVTVFFPSDVIFFPCATELLNMYFKICHPFKPLNKLYKI